MPISQRYTVGPLLSDQVSLTSSTGAVRGGVWPVGGLDSVTVYFQPFNNSGSGAWPTNLVMEVRCGLGPDLLTTWPGGAITLNSTTVSSLPYLSQEIRVTSLPWVGFVITTVASATWFGVFGIYGEGP